MYNLRNNVQLIGNIGQNPELKTFDNGKSLLRFTLATNQFYTNKEGEKTQDTQWHNIVAWDKLAETMHAFLEKGNEILVTGKLVYRSYEDKNGDKRYTSEIVLKDFMKFEKRRRELALADA